MDTEPVLDWASMMNRVISISVEKIEQPDRPVRLETSPPAIPEPHMLVAPVNPVGVAPVFPSVVESPPIPPQRVLDSYVQPLQELDFEEPVREEFIVETDRSRLELDPLSMPREQLERFRKVARSEASRCRTNSRGRRICGGISTSKGLCYQGVKQVLVKMGWVDDHWSDAKAVYAHTRKSLANRGFQNVMARGYTSETAPLGSILVYSGGPSGNGHIEIRTGENEFCSDHCKSEPIDQYMKRKLVGIYVKK
jgi:hypothetical protein